MAPTTKKVKLIAAAKEVNLGMKTAAEHLRSKGFEIEAKPTTRLTEEMYHILLADFSNDLALRKKKDKIEIGQKRRDKMEAKESAKAKKAAAPAPPKVEAPKVEPAVVEAKVEAPKETPAPPPAKKVEAPAEPVAKATEPVKKEEEVISNRSTKSGFKVLGKIDLEKQAADEKAKKDAAKAKKEAAKKEKAVAKKSPAKEKAKGPKTVKPSERTVAPLQQTIPGIKKKKVEKEEVMHERTKITLSGPTVLGKIELPKEEKKEKKPVKKKPRKRIEKSARIGANKNNRGGARRGGKTDNRGGRGGSNAPKEVSEKEIQDKIKKTMAKLSGGGAKKSSRSKVRKQKREAAAERERQLPGEDEKLLQVTEFISVSDLATLMNVSVSEVISACMSMGSMVSINQRLDAELIEVVADEFGYEVKFIDVTEDSETEEVEEEDDPADLELRPPIVTIMGHVDHGKTSLLDYIRKTNVIGAESGGITQHIGAYEVAVGPEKKKIAFLDTPGHEAFTAMRARGAQLTDIVVIVVAADDEVMPQTKEAISHAQAAGVPIIFAINKIDNPNSNPEKIKEQLSTMNFLVEDWGGKYQSQDISAKVGTNVEQLLEKILLEAEMQELKANPNKAALGTVVEASLDKGRGYVTTLMVQEGTMKIGDFVVSGALTGRIKAMFNERGQRAKEAGPSTPVSVLGLQGAPQAGERFKVYADESEGKNIAQRREQILREQGIRTQKHITLDEIGRRLALGNFEELKIIVKGDVDGSIEALSDSLLKLSTEEVQVNVIHKSVGQISESDVLLASASDAIICGFQVRPSASARKLAEKESIDIRMYSVIYAAIEEVKAAMEGMLKPTIEEKVVCNVEVREVFKISKIGTIAGCFVRDGKITRNTKVRLIRDGIVKYSGELASLKRFKDDAKEVLSGFECGLNIKNYNDIRVDDIIEGYEMVEIKRTLSK